jgi:hypothetical protein
MADQAQTALLLVVAMAAAMFALVYHVAKLNRRIKKLESPKLSKLSTECVDASALPESEFCPIDSLPELSTECVKGADDAHVIQLP